MKSKLFLVILSLVMLPATGFAQTIPGQNVNSVSATVPNINSQKDGEILALIITIDKNEMAASKAALERKLNPIVKNYVKMIKRDHTSNFYETITLSRKIGEKPVVTVDVTQLKENGKKELAALKQLNDKDFQVQFINDMVKSHQEGLQKINQALANVSNPKLKTHLEVTKNKIEEHLRKAQTIQHQLQSSNQ